MADDYDVFLLHNRADEVAVEVIARRLRVEMGLQPYFARWHLIPGELLMPSLERALDQSRAVAVFFGPNGAAAWHKEEPRLALVLGARDRGKPVIPVLLPGGRKQDIEGFLRLRTWVDLAAEDGFLRLVVGITGQSPKMLAERSENGGASKAEQAGESVEVVVDVSSAYEALVDELAKVFWDADQATTLVRSVGFPPALMPAFKTPIVFWARVVEAAVNGALADGVQALAAAAAKQYRANPTFTNQARLLTGAAPRSQEPEIAETEAKDPQGRAAPLEAKHPAAPASSELHAATAPLADPPRTTKTEPVEHRLSILHISDLHARSLDVDDLPDTAKEPRRRQVHREAASRARVLGPAWEDNLRALYPNGERPDIVCFTGDVADWGLPAEYAKATELVERTVRALGISKMQVYIVPGNHDVQRYVNTDEWRALRDLLPREARAVSEWLAGGAPPRAVDDRVSAAVLQRTAAFWQWAAQALGRPELLPAANAHGSLGYHQVVSLPRLPFDVHVIGLDSAWLAGDDHDQGKLWLTTHQRDMLLHDVDGRPWKGFRLALVHHPLEELAQSDTGAARRTLADTVDLLLHGHQHDPVGSSLIDLGGHTLRVLAAGCLYEGSEGSEWKNGCHRIDITLDEAGRPLRAEIQFRAWSSRGHWHADSSLYRGQTADGRMVWEAWDGARRSRVHDESGGHDADRQPAPTQAKVRDHDVATRIGDRPEDILPTGSAPSRGAVSETTEGEPPLGGETMASTAISAPDTQPVLLSGQAWNAATALEPILRAGHESFIEALERALSGSVGTAESRATRVAAAIDALGSGPKAAKRLLEACNAAWTAMIKSRQAGEILAASKMLVRDLSSLWLPRRYGDGTQVSRIDRCGLEGACPDLVVAANDAIITDVHVATEDDRRLDVGPGGGGAGAPVARLALPEPEALAAELNDPDAAAEEIMKGFSSQLEVLLVNTPQTRQRRIRGHLQLLRDHGEPRYMVLTQRSGIVEATLVALKKIFPPLRIVSLEGSLDEDESRILDILVHFFSDGDDGGAGRA